MNGSHTIDVVSNPLQAYEAAKQFGRFTKLLSDFPAQNLHITLPDFHNLGLRYQQFTEAVKHGNKTRVEEAHDLVEFLESQRSIVSVSENILHDPAFKKRGYTPRYQDQ